ncbi:MAG: hypothetical protein FWE02_03100 [Defluviitaleaceae bacterium]|nr:hypothetical protein [Defluviitaleaceae bacterium]
MKKYLATFMILILSFSSIINLQAYEEENEVEIYYQNHQNYQAYQEEETTEFYAETFQDEAPTMLHFQEPTMIYAEASQYEDETPTMLHFHEQVTFFPEVGGITKWSGVTEDGIEFTATDGILIGTGITDCGIPFRAFKPSNGISNISSRQIGDSRYTSTIIEFPSNMIPPATIMWSESVGGRMWSGTLQRRDFFYWNGQNVTLFSGIVWAVN